MQMVKYLFRHRGAIGAAELLIVALSRLAYGISRAWRRFALRHRFPQA